MSSRAERGGSSFSRRDFLKLLPWVPVAIAAAGAKSRESNNPSFNSDNYLCEYNFTYSGCEIRYLAVEHSLEYLEHYEPRILEAIRNSGLVVVEQAQTPQETDLTREISKVIDKSSYGFYEKVSRLAWNEKKRLAVLEPSGGIASTIVDRLPTSLAYISGFKLLSDLKNRKMNREGFLNFISALGVSAYFNYHDLGWRIARAATLLIGHPLREDLTFGLDDVLIADEFNFRNEEVATRLKQLCENEGSPKITMIYGAAHAETMGYHINNPDDVSIAIKNPLYLLRKLVASPSRIYVPNGDPTNPWLEELK